VFIISKGDKHKRGYQVSLVEKEITSAFLTPTNSGLNDILSNKKLSQSNEEDIDGG
jgi:hypothetical protein